MYICGPSGGQMYFSEYYVQVKSIIPSQYIAQMMAEDGENKRKKYKGHKLQTVTKFLSFIKLRFSEN